MIGRVVDDVGRVGARCRTRGGTRRRIRVVIVARLVFARTCTAVTATTRGRRGGRRRRARRWRRAIIARQAVGCAAERTRTTFVAVVAHWRHGGAVATTITTTVARFVGRRTTVIIVVGVVVVSVVCSVVCWHRWRKAIARRVSNQRTTFHRLCLSITAQLIIIIIIIILKKIKTKVIYLAYNNVINSVT